MKTVLVKIRHSSKHLKINADRIENTSSGVSLIKGAKEIIAFFPYPDLIAVYFADSLESKEE
jgi:hypothetical protein